MGGRPGLVFMGGDSHSKGYGFEFRMDMTFFTLIGL